MENNPFLWYRYTCCGIYYNQRMVLVEIILLLMISENIQYHKTNHHHHCYSNIHESLTNHYILSDNLPVSQVPVEHIGKNLYISHTHVHTHIGVVY